MEQGSTGLGEGAPRPRERKGPASPVYSVELEVFEGPLDLLLHLVRKHELDILDIPIAFVAEKYLAYLDVMRQLDLEIAGDYLVMAATLAYLKSRELLPPEPRAGEAGDGEEEAGEDPREALIRRLVEYERFKQAAVELDSLPMSGRDVFARGAELVMPPIDPGLAPVSLFNLAEAYYRVLTRAKVKSTHEVTIEPVTVAQRIKQLALMLDEKPHFEFEELFLGRTWGSERELRQMLVVTLMSILEMVKLGVAGVQQPLDSPTIQIYRRATAEQTQAALADYNEEASFGAPKPEGGASGEAKPPVERAAPRQPSEAELDAVEEATLLAEALAGVQEPEEPVVGYADENEDVAANDPSAEYEDEPGEGPARPARPRIARRTEAVREDRREAGAGDRAEHRSVMRPVPEGAEDVREDSLVGVEPSGPSERQAEAGASDELADEALSVASNEDVLEDSLSPTMVGELESESHASAADDAVGSGGVVADENVSDGELANASAEVGSGDAVAAVASDDEPSSAEVGAGEIVAAEDASDGQLPGVYIEVEAGEVVADGDASEGELDVISPIEYPAEAASDQELASATIEVESGAVGADEVASDGELSSASVEAGPGAVIADEDASDGDVSSARLEAVSSVASAVEDASGGKEVRLEPRGASEDSALLTAEEPAADEDALQDRFPGSGDVAGLAVVHERGQDDAAERSLSERETLTGGTSDAAAEELPARGLAAGLVRAEGAVEAETSAGGPRGDVAEDDVLEDMPASDRRAAFVDGEAASDADDARALSEEVEVLTAGTRDDVAEGDVPEDMLSGGRQEALADDAAQGDRNAAARTASERDELADGASDPGVGEEDVPEDMLAGDWREGFVGEAGEPDEVDAEERTANEREPTGGASPSGVVTEEDVAEDMAAGPAEEDESGAAEVSEGSDVEELASSEVESVDAPTAPPSLSTETLSLEVAEAGRRAGVESYGDVAETQVSGDLADVLDESPSRDDARLDIESLAGDLEVRAEAVPVDRTPTVVGDDRGEASGTLDDVDTLARAVGGLEDVADAALDDSAAGEDVLTDRSADAIADDRLTGEGTVAQVRTWTDAGARDVAAAEGDAPLAPAVDELGPDMSPGGTTQDERSALDVRQRVEAVVRSEEEVEPEADAASVHADDELPADEGSLSRADGDAAGSDEPVLSDSDEEAAGGLFLNTGAGLGARELGEDDEEDDAQ